MVALRMRPVFGGGAPVVAARERPEGGDSIVFDGCGEATLGEVMMLDAEVEVE